MRPRKPTGDWRVTHREEEIHLQHLERKWKEDREALRPVEIRELGFSPRPGIAAWAADQRT